MYCTFKEIALKISSWRMLKQNSPLISRGKRENNTNTTNNNTLS